MTKKEVLSEASLAMTILDAFPVLFFSVTMVLVSAMLQSHLFTIGAVLCALGGIGKVSWKLLLAIRKKDVRFLNMQFRYCMSIGFGCMAVSLLIRRKDIPWFSVWETMTAFPGNLLFGVGIFFFGMMILLSKKLDMSTPKANWIEETCNCIGQLFIMLGVLLCWYASGSYTPDQTAMDALQDSGEVLVKEIEKGYLFDGPGDENAIVFYPGGLVDYRAYAPLMQQIAGTGIDCFLVRMNYNLAFLGINKAQELQTDYSYRNWYMMGHSLGGVAAASYAAGRLEELAGIIFLASYPTKSLQADGFRALSVYGSNDGLVDREEIERSREQMPEDYREVCIEGGSHAQFGNYGSQKKDGVPTINASEVQRQTTDAIRDCILR